ncbi:peptidoglycan-binding domain-containing protein [Kitasatospora sp. NPDC049258]|uniref:peptidoglycan-binding domain-containing protein n=1 Tax=Kitasatospora sp. NPDC049258 TaxID=3155394 RepID=UPI00343CEB4D
MPAEHCPLCGAPRTAGGCACQSSIPSSFDETVVMPHVEGPPLVRPYVPAAVGYEPSATPDPFATALMPQAPAAPRPPSRPQYPPQSPTQPTQEQPYHQPDQQPYHQPDLGSFSVREHVASAPLPEQRRSAAARRRAAVVGAGLGIVALGAGLALALAPSDKAKAPDQALPVPTSAAPDQASPDPGPSASPSASPSTKPSPSPSASRSASKAASSAPASSAAPSPSPSPSAASSAPASSAAPSPSQSAPRATLQQGDKGADVSAMQQRLADVLYWAYDDSLVTGTFDSRTKQAVNYFQNVYGQSIPSNERGKYGPVTRSQLEAMG